MRDVSEWFCAEGFIPRLAAFHRAEAIEELSIALCAGTSLDPTQVAAEVLAREELMPTGLGHQVAIPHARLPGLPVPRIGVGLSEAGVDFEAPDAQPARVLFLILTPKEDPTAQLHIIAAIAGTLQDPSAVGQMLAARDLKDIVTVLQGASSAAHG